MKKTLIAASVVVLSAPFAAAQITEQDSEFGVGL